MIIQCTKGELSEECFFTTDERDNLRSINIQGKYCKLSDIPSIVIDDETVHYLQYGTNIYLIVENLRQHITNCYIIEQAIKDKQMIIKNIHTITEVREQNALFDFYSYNKKFETLNIMRKLPTILSKLPFADDSEYLKGKIFDYLATEDTPQANPTEDIPKKTTKKTTKKTSKKKYPVPAGLTQICKEHGVSQSAIFMKIQATGMPVEQAIEEYKLRKERRGGKINEK